MFILAVDKQNYPTGGKYESSIQTIDGVIEITTEQPWNFKADTRVVKIPGQHYELRYTSSGMNRFLKPLVIDAIVAYNIFLKNDFNDLYIVFNNCIIYQEEFRRFLRKIDKNYDFLYQKIDRRKLKNSFNKILK